MAYILHSGDIANSETVHDWGYMHISSGGVANSTTVNDWGEMYIFSGGVANSTTVNDYSYMHISSGGVANSTTVNDWGEMYIFSGGVANSTTVNSSGRMYVYDGGIASSTMVNSGGCMHISSGGVANSTMVDRGCMHISSGGTATDVIWTPCVGRVIEEEGAYVTYASQYSGVYFGSADQLLSSAKSMDNKIVSGGSMYVMSGGVANSTTVHNWGYMYISSGGVANSTTVHNWGYMYISSGGSATDLTLKTGGVLGGFSFGEEKYFDEISDGSAVISENVFILGNEMLISRGGVANSTMVSGYGATMHISSGGVANSTTVNYYGAMYISSGGVANSTTVSLGYMYIENGGVANSTTVDGWMFISSGGVANNTWLDDGDMYISSGGVANNTTVNNYGAMYISSGGVANCTTVNYGDMYISSGGVVSSTTVNEYSSMYIKNGGVANSTMVNSNGDMYISDGGVANSTTVNRFGSMRIFSGVANSTTVNSGGNMFISSGGVANSTMVNSNGDMYISDGGTHRGTLQLNAGAVVSAYEGSTIDFTLTDRTPEDGYLINELALIQGAPTYTITVSANQVSGVYKLAQGASSFTGSITIGTETENYGTLTVNGEALSYGNFSFNLLNTDGNLQLNVRKHDVIVSSGSVVSGTQIFDEKLTILDGAVTSDTEVKSGGSMLVSGGVASDTTVSSGGNMTIFEGGVASTTEVKSGGSMRVSSGGVASNTTLYTGGTMNISNGGKAIVASISSGGSMQVSSGGVASNTTLKAGGTMNISNGGKAIVASISSGGSMQVFSGGVASNTTLKAGGVLNISSGGKVVMIYNPWQEGTINSAYGATLTYNRNAKVYYGGGTAGLLSSGSAMTNLKITSGRSALVSSGGSVLNPTVSSGGALINNGYVSGLVAYAGAKVSGTGIYDVTSRLYLGYGVAGQDQTIQYVNSLTFSGFSNFIATSGLKWRVRVPVEFKETRITRGGSMTFMTGASATKIENEGYLMLSSGCNVRSVTNEGSLYVKGGHLTLNINCNGGIETVYGGGSSYRTYLSAGGTQHVSSGGRASGTTIFNGGVQRVFANGTAVSGFISNGGLEIVSGGVASGMQVLAGGSQYISGGSAVSTLINRGSQCLYGGAAKVTKISHGSQYIYGGVASNTTLNGTTKQHVKTLTSSFEYTGDTVYWYNSGGSRQILNNDWQETVTSTTEVYYFGYTASQGIYAGGKASQSILSSGAIQTVFDGGRAYATTVHNSAFQYVLSGGTVYNTVVSSGGIMTVEYDGYAENIRVRTGGAIGVHGVVRNLTIEKGANYYFHLGEAVFCGYLDCYLTQNSLAALREILPFSNDLTALYLRVDKSQKIGTYTLSDFDAGDAKITLGIKDANLATLTANGQAISYNNRTYKLRDTASGLKLQVTSGMTGKVVTAKEYVAPTGGKVVAVQSGQKGIKLTISGFKDNVKVTKYYVYLNGKKVATTTSTTYTYKSSSNLIGKKTVMVKALDAAGNISEGRSAEITLKDITAPTGGKVVAAQSGQKNIKVTISGFKDNVKVTKYYVYVNGKKVATTTSTSYTYKSSSNLIGKKTVMVKALDAAGKVSAGKSVAITIKDVTAPSKVTGLKVSGTPTQSYAKLVWSKGVDNVGVTKYAVKVSGVSKTYTTTTNSLVVKGLTAGKHTYQVYAYDAAGRKSVVSTAYSFNVKDITKPTGGKITLKQASQNSVKITISSFKDNVKVAKYYVYVNGKKVATTGSTTYTYKQSANFTTSKLTFAVKAADATGNISVAKSASFAAKVRVSGKATNLSTVLAWTKPSISGTLKRYEITVSGKKYTSTTNKITIKGLAVGTRSVTIKAVNTKNQYKTVCSGEQIKVVAATVNKTISGITDGVKDVNGITGSAANDIVTFQKDRDFNLLSDISLGSGDDKLIIPTAESSPGIAFESGAGVSFDAGNDTLDLGSDVCLGYSDRMVAEGFSWEDLVAGTLNFGTGNDMFRMREDSECSAKSISFGDGNDTLQLDHNAWLDLNEGDGKILLGAGNDKLILGDSSELEASNTLTLDFGSGTDTMTFNGDVEVYADQLVITGLENITGSGSLVLNSCTLDEETEAKFKQAGITVTLA